MSTRNRITFFVIALVLLALIFPIGYVLAQDSPEGTIPRIFLPMVANRANQDSNPAQVALNIIAARTGVPVSDLAVDAIGKMEYKYLGQTTDAIKVSNNVTGEGYVVELNAAGQEVDQAAMLAADAQAYADLYGKIEPSLRDALAAAGDQAVPVIIALNGADEIVVVRPEPGAEMTEEQYKAFRADAVASQEAAIEAVTGPFVTALSEMGIKVEAASQLAYAYGSLRANEVNSIANMAEVRSIGLDVQNQSDLSYIWGRAGYTTVYGRHIIGRGVKVAINEVGHGIDPGSQYLRFMYSHPTTRCGSASSHEIGVAGIIYSSHPTYTGLAMGSQLGTFGSCAGSSAELQTAANNAISWGADVVNNSWGATVPSRLLSTTNEGFYDNLVRNTGTTIVKSAGNNGNGNGYVSNPGAAYNILTVGAEDKTSPATIASYSSWVDADTSHDDMTKPEVTATGSSVYSTLTNGSVGNIGSGTSFSSPVVAALAADVISRNYTLGSWPEPLKAIIMASATRDIQAGTTAKDGAGGVNFTAADDVVRGASGWYGYGGYSCSTATPLTLTTISITAGKTVRFVFTWDTTTGFAYYTTRPVADIDLKAYRNDTGAQVASSASWDRTNEWVQFTAPVSTTYTFKAVRYTCYTPGPGYYGWAYYRWP
jgi:hypothetical protein